MTTKEQIAHELDGLSEPALRQVLNFVQFLAWKSDREPFDGLSLSRAVLSQDWDTPQDDAAWEDM
jgi:hypothetical protein